MRTLLHIRDGPLRPATPHQLIGAGRCAAGVQQPSLAFEVINLSVTGVQAQLCGTRADLWRTVSVESTASLSAIGIWQS